MKIKQNRLIQILLVLTIVLNTSPLAAQELLVKDRPEIPRDSLMTIARAIIDSARARTFITVDEHGKPQARTMSVFPPEEDMVIWLGTSTNSRKVKQIKNNANVMVFYYDTKGHSYVSVAGQACLVNDPEKKAHYWKKNWTSYYPNPEKDYILIKVTPERMEICSFKYKLFWNSQGLPAFIEF